MARLLAGLLGLLAWSRVAAFELASPQGAAAIVVPAGEPAGVVLAAQDLARDVERITGRQPRIVRRLDDGAAHAVLVATASRPESRKALERVAPGLAGQLDGKWEAYRVRTPAAGGLVIAGSGDRGTLFGLYAFAERHLGVDPLHFWADRPPPKRERLAWDKVDLAADEPTFRYRGWFLNDEDLLTEWFGGGGTRDIAYPYYHQVTSPQATRHVFEAALRLGYNLVIPASFVDIRNPAEERLVADAVRRGLLVTQHHIEPLGVSGFAFANYWRDKGRKVPFSFVRHRGEFEAVWRHYARRWAKYAPSVVWQLGLRGVADRPVWASDPAVPKDAAARGKLISEAMALQAQIVREADPRPNPPMTTTLWMEGAALHAQGHLKFPPGVCVVFADNSPGWELQRDFHEAKREPGRPYGIYYHHQLWGSGPHLVQAVPPWGTHRIFALAVERGASHYAMLNVGNVREFVLGLDASARMLRDFGSFRPGRYLGQWCAERFGPAAAEAETCYRRFFGSFVDARGRRRLLDGQLVHTGTRFLTAIRQRVQSGQRPLVRNTQAVTRRLAAVRAQRAAVEDAASGAGRVLGKLGQGAADRRLFEANFLAQQRILLGLLLWLETSLHAGLALQRGDRDAALGHLRAAQAALETVRAGQSLASKGQTWRHWYRGDRKMNLGRAESLTQQVLAAARAVAK